MKSKDYFVLKKIIEYCNQVDEAVNMFGNDYNCFTKNSVYRNACCMCILQIGELTTRLTENFKVQHAEIPWKQIKAMRNIHAHESERVDFEGMWETLTEDIPDLRGKLVTLLQEEESI